MAHRSPFYDGPCCLACFVRDGSNLRTAPGSAVTGAPVVYRHQAAQFQKSTERAATMLVGAPSEVWPSSGRGSAAASRATQPKRGDWLCSARSKMARIPSSSRA
jgi:hypothetical protein